MYNHAMTPNHATTDCVEQEVSNSHGPYGNVAARSYHASGVHILMGDGSVDWAGNNIDLSIWIRKSMAAEKERAPGT